MAARRLWGRWVVAACSAGAMLGLAPTASRAAPGCDAVIYFDANFGGENREVYGDERFVGPHWNDQISSIRILSGDWVFYRDADYGGDVLRFGPGTYPSLPPRWNDQISSFQCFGGTAGDDGTYVYQGQTYGWYEGGWNGPGFYVVGLQRVRGRGFGGRDGDHGWHHHDRGGRDHPEPDHPRPDHGGRPGPGFNPGGPLRPGPGPGPGFRPPHHGGHPRPRPGGFHPPPHPHPGGSGHPHPRPHPGGGHPHPHPGGGHPGPHRHR